jgi:hypothetical protein
VFRLFTEAKSKAITMQLVLVLLVVCLQGIYAAALCLAATACAKHATNLAGMVIKRVCNTCRSGPCILPHLHQLPGLQRKSEAVARQQPFD